MPSSQERGSQTRVPAFWEFTPENQLPKTRPMNLRVWSLMFLWVMAAAAREPLTLHPQNPHYFLWRGEPTILITSAEHFGSVI